MSPRLCVSAGDLPPSRFPQQAKEPMHFGLHAGSQGMQAGLHRLEGISRRLKAGEHFLEPGQVGLEGEEQLLKGKAQALKGEELFFEQPESGLREMRRSLQQTALGMDASAWLRRPAAGREPARAETDLPPVHPVVRVPSRGGTDAVPPSTG